MIIPPPIPSFLLISLRSICAREGGPPPARRLQPMGRVQPDQLLAQAQAEEFAAGPRMRSYISI
jgi:hypothetical protein